MNAFEREEPSLRIFMFLKKILLKGLTKFSETTVILSLGIKNSQHKSNECIRTICCSEKKILTKTSTITSDFFIKSLSEMSQPLDF